MHGLLTDWAAFIQNLAERPVDDRPDAAHPIADVAATRIARVYRQMVKMGRRIDDDSPSVALHDLRKKGKELRYLLEFFSSLFPEGTVKPMVRTLKALQDTLGRFQDREVQAALLRSLRDEVALREGGPPALMAMGVLVERFHEQQLAARTEFAERFGAFASKSRRALVAETFE
jgi:CHAD domain-containing protein